jgi:hypothetical protein
MRRASLELALTALRAEQQLPKAAKDHAAGRLESRCSTKNLLSRSSCELERESHNPEASSSCKRREDDGAKAVPLCVYVCE